jgi:hypothetical protein
MSYQEEAQKWENIHSKFSNGVDAVCVIVFACIWYWYVRNDYQNKFARSVSLAMTLGYLSSLVC